MHGIWYTIVLFVTLALLVFLLCRIEKNGLNKYQDTISSSIASVSHPIVKLTTLMITILAVSAFWLTLDTYHSRDAIGKSTNDGLTFASALGCGLLLLISFFPGGEKHRHIHGEDYSYYIHAFVAVCGTVLLLVDLGCYVSADTKKGEWVFAWISFVIALIGLVAFIGAQGVLKLKYTSDWWKEKGCAYDSFNGNIQEIQSYCQLNGLNMTIKISGGGPSVEAAHDRNFVNPNLTDQYLHSVCKVSYYGEFILLYALLFGQIVALIGRNPDIKLFSDD